MASTRSVTVDMPVGPETTTFKLTKKHLLGNYDLHQQQQGVAADEAPRVYHVVASHFRSMDITLYAGPDRKSSPAVGAGRIATMSRDHKLGYAPASSPSPSPSGGKEDFMWEDMRREKLTEWGYAFSFTPPPSSSPAVVAAGGGRRDRVALMWKRTTHVTAAGMKASRLSVRNFKLVDRGDEGRVLAVFTAARGWSSCGTLQINVDWGVGFERVVVVSCVTLYEKVSRETAGDSADTPG
ncbi:hypothetical protein N3K66_002967 [Trichothecium roseum]|uniref:Uncharacterized protein n=1 Tax=Trichothecium roseum TaxID=47278 RepID=A0ACC0V3W9_9HYPO|nr:hypothetical protein N3K66_002967 [Trichothecium roseum]